MRARSIAGTVVLLAGLGLPAAPQDASRAKLQSALTRAMQGRTGAAVVVDVDTGRVLASHRLDLAARTLAVPGSAVKPFTLLALLESGKVKADDPVLCRYDVRIGTRRMNCSHPRTGEAMRAATALAWSCNSYFSELASRLTDDELVAAFRRAGLTAPTGLAASEAIGIVRPPRSAEQRQLLALGSDGIQITPLALAAAYRKLALARSATNASPALAVVWEGLRDSVRYGMGSAARVEGVEVAGKTGTAAGPGVWTHAWFAGFAPAEKPEIVVVVYLEAGRGGLDAAPLAREVFAAWAGTESGQWFPYEPAVVGLGGRVVLVEKFGPPNYGENPETDQKVRVPILVLSQPVNVRGNPHDVLNSESILGVREIQLVFMDRDARQLAGRPVVVRGTLFRRHTGHHYTDVLMIVREIREAPR